MGRRQRDPDLVDKIKDLRDQGFSYAQIGRRLNISKTWAQRLVPSYGRFHAKRHCALCNREYEVNQHGHDRSVYCSDFCAVKAWNLGYRQGIRPVRDTIRGGQ